MDLSASHYKYKGWNYYNPFNWIWMKTFSSTFPPHSSLFLEWLRHKVENSCVNGFVSQLERQTLSSQSLPPPPSPPPRFILFCKTSRRKSRTVFWKMIIPNLIGSGPLWWQFPSLGSMNGWEQKAKTYCLIFWKPAGFQDFSSVALSASCN